MGERARDEESMREINWDDKEDVSAVAQYTMILSESRNPFIRVLGF